VEQESKIGDRCWREGGIERVRRQIWQVFFIFVYENRTMKLPWTIILC
jgi:hypothetical protein